MSTAESMGDRIVRIKQQNSLVAYAASDLGQPEDEKRNQVWYCCPFHPEDTPSFVIYKDTEHWRCYGGCNTGGDLPDYWMRRTGLGLKDFVDQFDSANSVQYKPKPRAVRVSEPEKPAPTMADALAYHRFRSETVGYFAIERGLDERLVDTEILGTQVKYNWPYEFRSERLRGREKAWFEGRRYTIPWLSGNNVKCINKRRDDEYAVIDLQLSDPDLIEDVRLDLFLRSREKWQAGKSTEKPFDSPEAVTHDDLVSACYGPKYHKDGEFPVYGVNQLYQRDDAGDLVLADGKPILRRLVACLVVEGEIDAMTAMQAGFPAIAAKVKANVPYSAIFANVRYPYIIADSDAAGAAYANAMQKALGRGKVVLLPDGYKDLNDLGRAGKLTQWLYDAVSLQPSSKIVKAV